jgi:uncharacterized protein YjbJ (UPF0337 family)
MRRVAGRTSFCAIFHRDIPFPYVRRRTEKAPGTRDNCTVGRGRSPNVVAADSAGTSAPTNLLTNRPALVADVDLDSMRSEKSVAAPFSESTNLEEIKMNWDRIEGNWKQFKGNVKTQWGKLTDDELDVVAGNRDNLAGRIQEAYGISKEDVEKQLNDWQSAQK